MRDIKFRGRYVFKKNSLYPAQDKWVYGSLVMEGGAPWIKDGFHSFLVRPESVGQFTGIKIRRKHLYEGDIVDTGWDGVCVVKATKNPWGMLSFDIVHLEYGRWRGWNMDKAKIIGNIYENPELLPDKDDKGGR